jgi:hypothetical protein
MRAVLEWLGGAKRRMRGPSSRCRPLRRDLIFSARQCGGALPQILSPPQNPPLHSPDRTTSSVGVDERRVARVRVRWGSPQRRLKLSGARWGCVVQSVHEGDPVILRKQTGQARVQQRDGIGPKPRMAWGAVRPSSPSTGIPGELRPMPRSLTYPWPSRREEDDSCLKIHVTRAFSGEVDTGSPARKRDNSRS